jgi:hypothetical protein
MLVSDRDRAGASKDDNTPVSGLVLEVTSSANWSESEATNDDVSEATSYGVSGAIKET